MDKQIESFLEFIENDKKLSDNTLQSYRRDVLQYEKYVEANDINYTKVKSNDIKDYLQYLHDMNKKSSTISRNLASIRLFYQFLLRNNKVKADPTEEFQVF